ncbi:MAG: polysaccharide deacetylase family protein [Sphingomonadaceae bacterium]
MLGGKADEGPARYVLETLLSTIGVPFRYLSDPRDVETGVQGRPVYLVVGPVDDSIVDRLARRTAVVALPGPVLSAIGRQLIADGARRSADRPATPRCGAGSCAPPTDGQEAPWAAHKPLPYACQSSEPKPHPPDPVQVGIVRRAAAEGYLVVITEDVIGPSFDLLSRAEEHSARERDRHDRFLSIHSQVLPPEHVGRPLVSEYARLLRDCLKEACAGARIPTICKEPWPLGKPMAGCLTHDVDVVRRGKLPRGVAVRDVRGAISSLRRGQLRAAAGRAATIARTALSGRDPYWTFDRILALEKQHDYRSTFYFMTVRQHPEDATYRLDSAGMAQLLSGLAGLGCEIGLHGSYASYLDGGSLRSQKVALEQRIGREVTGHRNHLLRFRAPDSWIAQEWAGFSYDATLGFADREGFRGAHAFPFHPYDPVSGQASSLLEVPLAVMDVSLLKYRKLRGERAEAAVRSVLEQVRATGGLATLLWHNDTFYDPEYPGSGHLYLTALRWLAENDAYVATAGEIDRWWRARSAVSLRPIQGGGTGWRMECPAEIAGLALRISLPDLKSSLRVRGKAPLVLKREGQDYLLEFGLLPAGFTMDIEYE